MPIMNQLMGEAYRLVERQNPSTITPTPTNAPPPATSSPTGNGGGGGGGGGGGPTSSPLLFFVALGFGVVFTNLWIIVGVKYCFRYNARNRAIRNGEEVDPINLENMPTRPHRRRREKKLMTMDEVNERFPMTKYKAWVATRASEGLPTTGGVTAPPSRAGSVRDVDLAMPSSPVDTKHSVNTRPATAVSDVVVPPATTTTGGLYSEQKKADEVEKKKPTTEDSKPDQVQTTPLNRHTTNASSEDDDDDEHIHTAVLPELLANPGDSCAICIDTLEDDDDIRGLTCGHAFHAGCLDPWLTSRRACCPLCKADYYTPKPRPEGETAETERSGRRRDARNAHMPQAPTSSTWTGLRGSPRLLLPTRFGSAQIYDNGRDEQGRRIGRRGRRQAAETAAATADAGIGQPQPTASATTAPEITEVQRPAQARWRPSNPFSTFRFPGRNRQAPASADQSTPNAEPSPSQLEAGTATATTTVR